jgi:carboxypeptidase C (cathepsin A)
MFGLFVELGPFYLDGSSEYTEFAQKTGIPSLFRNEYSWSKLANLLIINSPPPVGYSYCDPAGPEGGGYSCGTWNDEKTARHNRMYLESFFKRFPKFQGHDFYSK